ncbi:hypothetical protein GCM10025767_31280 [Thalassotalea piscium]
MNSFNSNSQMSPRNKGCSNWFCVCIDEKPNRYIIAITINIEISFIIPIQTASLFAITVKV